MNVKSERAGRRAILVLIAVGLTAGARPMPGQAVSYFRQFTTTGMDRAASVAADASGVYVAGNRPTPQNAADTGGVRKYDSRGNELWSREFSRPVPDTVQLFKVVAVAGGVYVAGAAGVNSQLVLRKYSAEGGEVWTRSFDFYAPGDIAADNTGVYITGRDFPPNATYLRKLSPEGAELWTSRWGERNSQEFSGGLTVDATGVYALSITGPYSELVIRKFDAQGNPQWTRPLDYLLVGSPGRSIASDSTGIYLISGNRNGAYTLGKYDTQGKPVWAHQLDKFLPFVNAQSVGAVYPSGLTADATGIYIAGFITFARALPGQCMSGSGGDSFVIRYDRDGAEVWTRQFGTAEAAWAGGVAVDASSVYVVGREGTAQVRDYEELNDVLAPANPANAAFLAKLDKIAPAVAGPAPRIFPGCVVNAASYVGGGVAPGEIVALFGSAMGPSELVRLRLTEDRRVAASLADTRILFNGVPAPLLYVSDKQSSAIVPYAVAGRTTVEVQVEYRGVRSDPVTVPLLDARPGIFSLDSTGEGQGAILNEDGTVNSPASPARRSSIITIFGTGGEAGPNLVDGEIVSGISARSSLPVSVFFARGLYEEWGKGEVLYAGGSPGSVAGLLQVNVRVPANSSIGDRVPLAVVIGSHWTVFQITVAVR